MSIQWRYANTPGRPASPPAAWPVGAPVQPAKGRATLVMFAHPHCPCSRASIGELAIIMTRAQDRLKASVFFYVPAGEANTWARTNLWHSTKSIPGVDVIEDPEGAAALSFGAVTSGQTLLYDAGGRLVFNGGITASRGHSGDNYGRNAIITLLQGGSVEQKGTPVFGCSLRGE